MIERYGIRLLHFVIWLTFSFVTCLAIKWLWEEVGESWHPLVLYPLTTIIATGFTSVGRWLTLEMRGLHLVVEPIERDEPRPLASWPASAGRDKFEAIRSGGLRES